METPIPNPFNGAEMFNGQSHHRAAFDDEDFGPETDVDMVDDVLLSPAIAAAKALVHGANDDDFERQRQQTKEFDDPVDLDRSRDTPTPPAHEVARDASGDNLAESGGEESEEEWNYIPGDDSKNQASAQALSKQEEEDMNSQLNPNAAEFVPVSPKRLMDDPIIASSPTRGFEKSLEDLQLPSEFEFKSEISKRPGDLEYSNGPKHGEDDLENSSTLDKSNGLNSQQACSKLASESLVNFGDIALESVPFDKLAALQKMEEKVTSAVLEKANIFGPNNDFSNNSFESTNIFGNGDPMTASFMGKNLPLSPEAEEFVVPGTPRSTTVEAPTSPITDEIAHQTDLDSPADEFVIDAHKSPDLISPGDGPEEGLISAQERTSSSGFESESGADDADRNVGSEGVGNELRGSSPLDINFKPIENVSNTNPFCTGTNTLQQFEVPAQTQLETPKKDLEAEEHGDQFDFMQNAPSSFFSPRSVADPLNFVSFDQLESPEDIPHFVQPPSANSSFLATELPKSPEISNEIENLSPAESEITNYKTNVNELTQDLFSDDTNPEVEETSFTTEKLPVSEGSNVELETVEGVLATESKITQDEQECEQISKLDEDLKFNSHLPEDTIGVHCPVSPRAVDQVLASFDEIKLDEKKIEETHGLQESSRDSDIEVETKEMELELESHIVNLQSTPEEFKNLDEGFEVINKDELTQDNVKTGDLKTNVVSLESEEVFNPPEHCLERQEFPVQSQNNINNEFSSAVDQFSAAVNDNVIHSQNFNELASLKDPLAQFVEPEATKVVSYQTLTPANEPQITKSQSYVTGEEDSVKDPILDVIAPEIVKLSESSAPTEDKEPITEQEVTTPFVEPEMPVVDSASKCDPILSTVVTETLITNLEETSEIPTTEVPSSAGTPPPTPAPGLEDSKQLQDAPKTDILVAAVAAAGVVAAGSAIVTEKEAKKAKDTSSKKPTVGVKKPSEASKPQARPASTKAPSAKPASARSTATTTTTKAPGAGPKPPTTKPSAASTTAKKPVTATAAPRPAATRTVASTTAKPTTTALKSVPKQLPISKQPPKVPSKPTTPNSKPTTPTTLKSPLVKSDAIKSPTRPGVKSPLTTKPLASKTAIAEKKPLTNGDIKPLPKKSEVPTKPATNLLKSSLTKSTLTSKTLPPTSKTAPTKPASTSNTAKPKPTSGTVPKPTPLGVKRPSTGPAGKAMNGKEAVKQVTNTKHLLNGRSAPAKTGVTKKTDPKLSAKSQTEKDTKPPPIKKPEEMRKAEEKLLQVQEPNVTTTNGFADHIEDQNGLKIEDLAPLTVDSVN